MREEALEYELGVLSVAWLTVRLAPNTGRDFRDVFHNDFKHPQFSFHHLNELDLQGLLGRKVCQVVFVLSHPLIPGLTFWRVGTRSVTSLESRVFHGLTGGIWTPTALLYSSVDSSQFSL